MQSWEELLSGETLLYKCLGATLTVHGGRDDATSETGTFATGIETCDGGVMQEFAVARDAHRTAGTGLGRNERGLVGGKAMCILAEGGQTLTQTAADELGHPEVER